MDVSNNNPNIRKGQFLWRDESAKRRYLEQLTKKISDGFYFSDKVMSKMVDEMAPVFSDAAEHEGY